MPIEESPSGWRRLRVTSGFLSAVGPIDWRECGGDFEMGFRVDSMHCNPLGYCHGGMLATFADIVLGFGVARAIGNGAFLPTIGLNVEYLAPTPRGSWVSGQPEMLRLGRRIGVARCRITSDQTGLVMHASGTFKVDMPVNSNFTLSDYLASN
jgi:uncharacterized protein (TIGR00369 family)